MDYGVKKVSESVRIEPEKGTQWERQHKKEKEQRKGHRRDSVSISDEARRRSLAAQGEEGSPV